ncbi:MAG: hypothetical protein ABI233_04325 [Chthoniobacterales bacterium]
MVWQTIEGTYENGAVKLSGDPPAIDHARVLVTFLTSDHQVDLTARGIGPKQAAELGARLAPFAEDWNRPEMDAYDAL